MSKQFTEQENAQFQLMDTLAKALVKVGIEPMAATAVAAVVTTKMIEVIKDDVIKGQK